MIYDFITKEPEERFSKRLVEEVDNWNSISEDKMKV